jgi:hypothetical protein
MKPGVQQQLVATLERARRHLDRQWRDELILGDPDWMVLFDVHFRLAMIERRLRLLGRPQ